MNYVKLLYFTICFPCFVFGQNSAKQVSFRDLTVEHGLSQNSVVSIAQDSIGYMWFATQDGLNRYDGKSFKNFDKQFEDVTRPTFSKLGKIYVDTNKTLWIISNSGILEKYDTASESFITLPAFENVSDIFHDSHGNQYIGTFGQGLFQIDVKTKDTIQIFNNNDQKLNVYDFLETENGVVVATSNAVFIIKNATYEPISIKNYVQIKPSALAQTKENTLFVGTFGNGLFYQPSKDSELLPFDGFTDQKLPSDLNIQDVLVDKSDRLWIATYGDGVFLLDFQKETMQHFLANKNDPYALHYNDVLCLYEDFTGVVWLGTDGAGLSYYDEHLSKFNVLTNDQTPNDVSVEVVRAVSVDVQSNLWLGTSGKGLTYVSQDKTEFKTYTTSNSDLKSDRIMSLLTSDEELWIGFQGDGLQIMDANGRFQTISELSNYTFWKLLQAPQDNLWLCTRDNGLLLYNKEKGILKKYRSENSTLTTNNIRTIENDANGNLWIGTEDHGLFKLTNDTENIEKVPDVANQIKSLYDDGETLWIGTNGSGLQALDKETGMIGHFTKEEGLPNNVVYGILPDDQGYLWLSSNRGLSKFKLDDNGLATIENYSNYDGLQAYEFNTGAYYKDSDGRLYFGGLEGVNWFDPGQLTFNQTQPKTIISQVDLFAKPQALVQDRSFKNNENTLTFTFTGLHFSQPERNLYKYQLINHDLDWIASGNVNTAHYTNLPSSPYVFKVISSNYDGVWNQTPATYAFTILKPWYATNLARLLYACLLALTIFIIYRYLKWRWYMKMQLQLEHDETERLKKLDDFKTKLYTNISHEFRTPLTLISGPIDKQLSRAKLSQEDKEELTLVKRNANRLLNLVNQMLDLSKIESGNLKLSVSKGNLSMFLKQLAAAFEYKAQEKEINFSYQIEPIENAWYDKDVMEKIIANLLSNAIKYAPNKGIVSFEAAQQDGQIIITIINNGNTLSNEDLPKLFQRFYRSNKNTDGVGIGLSLVKELTILSHGNIVAHTMNEDDIQFTLTLPIERSYYNQAEVINDDQPFIEEEAREELQNFLSETKEKLNDVPLLLIIEDDKDIRHYIKSILRDQYKILEAINGKRGIEKALKHIPDLVISDIMMPEIDGIEVCNNLKQDERTSHIPIILLTAKVGEENEIKGLKTGADAYVTKPFNSEKLKIRVNNLIELRQQLRQRYSQYVEVSPKELSNSSIDQKFFKRIQGVLDEHLSDPQFNSDRFVSTMAMSRMQLHRKLKALTGLTTSEFIRSQRLKHAVKLINETDLTVSEIAYEIGFNTPSYFIKCFKETYQVTPNEFSRLS